MAKIGWIVLAVLLAGPASASVVYTFTETWSNPYNRENPTGSFGFSFAVPTFLSTSGFQYIPASQFLTCELNGMDPKNACSGAWIGGGSHSVSVEMLVYYLCPDCEFDPYPLAYVYFEGAGLQSFGDWTAPAGANSTAELVIVDPPDLPSDAAVSVPEPLTTMGVLIGLALIAVRRWRIRTSDQATQ